MIDISHKFSTLRYAMARGTLIANSQTIERVVNKTVPKGDVLEVARAAGIQAAKRCSDWMVFCHPLPLDWIDIRYKVEETRIKVFAEARAVWKTGVEMEAMAGVTGALLNMYDMLKPIDEALSFGDIRLIKKRGGKSDFLENFEEPLSAAVLVISDSTYAGDREDRSGKAVREILQEWHIKVDTYEVLPDDTGLIRSKVQELADEQQIDLIVSTGGTGLGPRDLTPEALQPLITRKIPGIAEIMRQYGQSRMPLAMLSRQICGIRNNSLILSLPGSTNGAKESLRAIYPGLLHAFRMMRGGGHR